MMQITSTPAAVASAQPKPQAAAPKNESLPSLLRQAASHVDKGVNLLANADSAAVWGKPQAERYLKGMRETFGAAAETFVAAKKVMQPAQQTVLRNAALHSLLGSTPDYVRREGEGRGLIANYNTPGHTNFGGVTVVSFALLLDGLADEARRAAELLT